MWYKGGPCENFFRKVFSELPDLTFLFYYWPANIRNINYWIQYEKMELPPSWLVLEANSACPVSLQALLYSPLISSTTFYTTNKIVFSCLKIWFQFRRYFGLQAHSLQSSIDANHIFPPSLLDNTFLLWEKLGIKNGRIYSWIQSSLVFKN